MAKIYIDNARYMEFIDEITTQITEERFSSIGRREQSSSDRNRERKERKAEIDAKTAQRQKR